MFPEASNTVQDKTSVIVEGQPANQGEPEDVHASLHCLEVPSGLKSIQQGSGQISEDFVALAQDQDAPRKLNEGMGQCGPLAEEDGCGPTQDKLVEGVDSSGPVDQDCDDGKTDRASKLGPIRVQRKRKFSKKLTHHCRKNQRSGRTQEL